MFEEVRKSLFLLKKDNLKVYNEKVIPDLNNSIGVSISDLRKIAKRMTESERFCYVDESNKLYYEEILLEAIIIGKLDLNVDKLQYYIEQFLPKINNWAICDTFVCSLKSIGIYKLSLFDYFLDFLKIDKEYYKRFVYVVLMYYYLDDEYIDRIIDIVVNDKDNRYYVVMAKAWLLSKAFFDYRDKILIVLKNKVLDKKTHNKTIQKIKESLKVSESDKSMLNMLKV